MAVAADGRSIARVWTPPTSDESEADRFSLLTAWDLETLRPRFDSARVPHVAGRVALDRDGSLVAASGGDEGRVTIYDATTGTRIADVAGLPRPADAD